jgi:hypothetical protein
MSITPIHDRKYAVATDLNLSRSPAFEIWDGGPIDAPQTRFPSKSIVSQALKHRSIAHSSRTDHDELQTAGFSLDYILA